MPEQRIEQILAERAEIVGHAVNGVPESKLWRWSGYDKKHPLEVASFKDGGSTIRYHRTDEWYANVEFKNIRPASEMRNKHTEEIPLGDAEIIDGYVLAINNYDGITPVTKTYTGGFGKLRTREEAFSFGFTQSIEATFKFAQGNDAFAKTEQEIKLGFESRQDHSSTEGEQDSEQRDSSTEVTCPPGFDMKVPGMRTIQRMKLRVTATGDVEHEITIGKYHGGRFNAKRGAGGKRYKRHLHWDTYADFLACLNGEGRYDWDLAKWFRDNPPPKWLIKAAEAPLELPFSHEGVFDGATHDEVTPIVVRGPKE